MKLDAAVRNRSGNKCELCGSADGVQVYEVPPQNNKTQDDTIMVCAKCDAQLEKREEPDSSHWKSLTETNVERSAGCAGSCLAYAEQVE
jgi:protein PhnA